MGVLYNSRIVTDDLILCLDAGDKMSYPGAGTTWTDLSGRGNHFTLSGPVFSENNASSYFEFGDNQGDYAYRSTTDVIGGGRYITVDMWILITTLQDDIAFLSYATSSYNNEFLLYKKPDAIRHYWGTSNASVSLSSSYYNVGNWINLVFRRGSSTANYSFNGIQRASMAGTDDYIDAGGTLVFGQEQDSPGGGFVNAEDFPGYINSLKIYNRYLTNDEIRQNYNATKARFGL
jgi:hypothetical protein